MAKGKSSSIDIVKDKDCPHCKGQRTHSKAQRKNCKGLPKSEVNAKKK